MKLLEQYLTAIAAKLPLRMRVEIIKELRSNLLDEIEAKYGETANEEEVYEAIEAFGSPAEVAARYKGNTPVIAQGLADVFFLIIKIMFGGLAVSFTVIFIVGLIRDSPAGLDLFNALMRVPIKTLSAGLSGTGFVTFLFIILTRTMRDKNIDLEADWTPKDLASVEVDKTSELRLESIITIVVMFSASILLVVFPQIVTVMENLFGLTGIPLGHRIDVEVFGRFIPFITLFWLAEIIIRFYVIKKGKSRKIRFIEAGKGGLELILVIVMLFWKNLYLNDTGWIGFRVIFLIVLAVGIAEIVTFGVKEIRKKIAGGSDI
jgi:hypothetical protein